MPPVTFQDGAVSRIAHHRMTEDINGIRCIASPVDETGVDKLFYVSLKPVGV